MSAVPLAKAGVGSAVNDTTREVGGALGIAGLRQHRRKSAYRANLDLSGLGVPAEADRPDRGIGGRAGRRAAKTGQTARR